MFVINGNPSLWKINPIDGIGFSVKNTRAENVRLVVNDINYRDNLKELPDIKGNVSEDIYPSNLTIKYDSKTMIPEAYGIGSRQVNRALLAAVSIEVPENYRITSIFNNNARVYSRDVDPENHVYFIANFAMTNPDKKSGVPCINVTAVDYPNRKVITYSVRYAPNDDKVRVTQKRMNFEDIPKRGERGHIRTDDYIANAIESGKEIFPIYYPSSPTSAILMTGEDTSTLKEIISTKDKRWRKVHEYNIITGINEETLYQMHDEEGYDAVTVYLADGPVSLDDLVKSTWAARFGEDIANIILNLFSTIYLIGNDGSCVKAKLRGNVMRY